MKNRYTEIVLGLAFICLSQCRQPESKQRQETASETHTEYIPQPWKQESFQNRTDTLYWLDKKNEVRDTLIEGTTYPRLSGDFFVHLNGGPYPRYLYTSLMRIKVLKPSAFRVSAYDADHGQSVESLSGEIKIDKNYASPFPEPDTLRENNLYMINNTIDLSEKENLDNDQLATWWKKLKDPTP